jgi:uncharacterized protein DUF5658
MARVAWSCVFVLVFACAVAPLVAPARGSVSETALYPVTVAPPPPPPPPGPPPQVMSAPAPRTPAAFPRRAVGPTRAPVIPPPLPSAPLVALPLPALPLPAVPLREPLLRATSTVAGPAASFDAQIVRPRPAFEAPQSTPRPVVLVPMYASFATLQALDYHSTTTALSSGVGREANPLMRGVADNPAAFAAVKAGTTAGTIWIAERMRKKHPAGAVVFMLASNAAMAAVVAHNYAIR